MTTSGKFPLSVFIITHNEEKNIRRALESVAWAAERLVIDSGSDDNTVVIARELGARVEARPWPGSFGEYKETALRLTTHRWVLLLDADEEVTSEMAGFIQKSLAEGAETAAYAFRRRSFFCGTWIRGLGWYPDYVTRFFPKEVGGFSDDRVHERVVVSVPVICRKEEINHYSYRSVEEFHVRAERYAQLWAANAATQPRRSIGSPRFRSWITFLRCFFLKYGFIDGMTGLQLARLYAAYTRRKYELLAELQK